MFFLFLPYFLSSFFIDVCLRVCVCAHACVEVHMCVTVHVHMSVHTCGGYILASSVILLVACTLGV